MKYINILLIILIIGIISYMILNKNKERFALVDDTFNVIDITSDLVDEDCSDDNCDIKFIDVNYSTVSSNKSIYYVTNNNNIYILQTNGGFSTSRLNFLGAIEITAIAFTNDYNYGFLAIKSYATNNISIYYLHIGSNEWKQLEYEIDYDNDTTVISEYSDYCDVSEENIDRLNEKNIRINNIIINTTLSEGKEVPSNIVFTTYGSDKITRLEEDIYRSETTIQSIDLLVRDNSFIQNLEIGTIFRTKLMKYYLFENSSEIFVKHREIKKIIYDKLNSNYIVLIKNYTTRLLEKYELVCFNINGLEFIYDLTKVINSYPIDIKYYKNILNDRSYLVGLLKDKKNIVVINLSNSNTQSFSNLINTYSLQPQKAIVEIGLNNIYKIPINHSINTIYNQESGETIKIFDVDYNFVSLNGQDSAVYFDLYFVTVDNKINKVTFDSNFNMLDREIKNVDYPSEHISNIDFIGIHKKQKSTHYDSVIISNMKNIFIYRENKWKKIDNFNSEYSNYNKTDFISKINDSNKLVFKGDTNTDYKIYTISFDEDKYVDLLVVGGGGGGGYGGGGGGAGDAKYFNNVKFTKGTYNIGVGNGGEPGVIESDSFGKHGFNSYIEKVDDTDFTFNRIIVSGGGGGGGFNSNSTTTPILGVVGKSNYSSGAGGGAGKDKGIGGHGNITSGSGGSSLLYNNKLYGGGGGGSGYILELYSIHDNIEEMYKGASASIRKIGFGGMGSKVSTDFGYDDTYIVSIGGNGGFYGEVRSDQEEIFANKFDNYINKNVNVAGKGGDGSILITNDTEFSMKYKSVKSSGNPGIIVMITSKNIRQVKDEIGYQWNGDSIVDYYSLSDRNLKNEYVENLLLTEQKFKDRIKDNQVEKQKIIEERKQNKKNIYELEIREKDIMSTYNQGNSIREHNPIADAYLPYHNNIGEIDDNPNIDNEIEYKIITIYKQLLIRQPTPSELNRLKLKVKNYNITYEDIRNIIIQGNEYKHFVSLQSNDPNRNTTYNTSSNQVLTTVSEHYYNELKEEIPDYLLNPLKDIYEQLGFNEYLLRAALVNVKFKDFSDDIKENKDINSNNIMIIFYNYISKEQLLDKANDIIKYDKYNKLDNKNIVNDYTSDKYDQVKSIDDDFDDTITKNKLEELVNEDSVDGMTFEDTIDDLDRALEEYIQKRNSLYNEGFTNYNKELHENFRGRRGKKRGNPEIPGKNLPTIPTIPGLNWPRIPGGNLPKIFGTRRNILRDNFSIDTTNLI